MKFNNLLKLFEDNKGENIKLNKTDDKYIVQIYKSYHNIGNFKINYNPKVHIQFLDDKVEVTSYRKWGSLKNKTEKFELNDDIMKMKKFITTNFLTALVNYNEKSSCKK